MEGFSPASFMIVLCISLYRLLNLSFAFWKSAEEYNSHFQLYAENLGDIPPNTAAVQIKDGKKKRNVNLVSDYGKSGAVELIYVPK